MAVIHKKVSAFHTVRSAPLPIPAARSSPGAPPARASSTIPHQHLTTVATRHFTPASVLPHPDAASLGWSSNSARPGWECPLGHASSPPGEPPLPLWIPQPVAIWEVHNVIVLAVMSLTHGLFGRHAEPVTWILSISTSQVLQTTPVFSFVDSLLPFPDTDPPVSNRCIRSDSNARTQLRATQHDSGNFYQEHTMPLLHLSCVKNTHAM